MQANRSTLVSPGPLSPPTSFQESLTNGTYEFPLYPSSLLLATNIKLNIRTPFPFYSLPTLLKMSSDDHIQGGFGPFRFGNLFPSRMGKIKFRAEVYNNELAITFPGTQLIGYLCDIVPKFPKEVESKRYRRFSLPLSANDDGKKTHTLEKWLVSKKDRAKAANHHLPTDYREDIHTATPEGESKLHLGISPTSALLHMYTYTNMSSHTPANP